MVTMVMVRDDWERIIFPGVVLLLLILPVAASAADRPDLVVTGISFSPASPAPGEDVVMTATVQNIGTGVKNAGEWFSVMFVVDGEWINYRGTSTVLNPGESLTLTGKWDEVTFTEHYWTATAGSHTVEAMVDVSNVIVESNDANNVYSTTLVVGDGSRVSRSSGRQYNMHGAPGLGDGEFQIIDAICEFTPYIEVQVRYGGRLNDVGIAYERNGAVDQRIVYGASGTYGAHLVNPDGKIHIQATKWSGDNANGKPITVTVKNCFGKVLYEGQSTDNVFDVYLAMKGCGADEFAAWMAVNGPQE